ncbi:triggering receptor expressed on myeloid cells 1-like isoform 2-T5 [Hipposideros larvatus]
MWKIRLWGLLLTFFISELQAAPKLAEENFTLQEGQTLEVTCPFTVWKYLNSQKAWQRLTDGGGRLTLASTNALGKPTQIQVGRYVLKEFPADGILLVQVTNLQVADSGLYQCVIFQPPDDHIMLFRPVRLVVTKDHSSTPASDKNPSRGLAQISTLPPLTYNTRSKLPTSPRTETPLLPMTTASLSSPGLEVNPTHKTDVIRISLISIVVLVVCGILSKSLVFMGLLVVTQRSFEP